MLDAISIFPRRETPSGSGQAAAVRVAQRAGGADTASLSQDEDPDSGHALALAVPSWWVSITRAETAEACSPGGCDELRWK